MFRKGMSSSLIGKPLISMITRWVIPSNTFEWYFIATILLQNTVIQANCTSHLKKILYSKSTKIFFNTTKAQIYVGMGYY